jgi:hypothetical protein
MELLVFVAVAIGVTLAIVRVGVNARRHPSPKVRHRILGECEIICRIDEELAVAFCSRDQKEYVIDLSMTDELVSEK